MHEKKWHDLGSVEAFQKAPLTEAQAGGCKIAISFKNNEFGAVSSVCNHAGGPLALGRMKGDYIICPWHHWKYHRKTGLGEPGYEDEAVPSYELRIEKEHLLIRVDPLTPRT